MNGPCDRCGGPLYVCDAGFTTCVECERRPLVAAANAAKAEGMARATAARPADAVRVEAAIRRLAATGHPFSANDARTIHGVKGGVVGATFNALKAAGVIRVVGDETSTDKGTHGKSVALWVGCRNERSAA